LGTYAPQGHAGPLQLDRFFDTAVIKGRVTASGI
jgi:hypothetical protein